MTLIVFSKIAVSLLIIFVGQSAAKWFQAKRASEESLSILTTQMSRLLIDVTLPALAFVQILKTTDASAMRDAWLVPLLGFLIASISALVGAVMARLVGVGEQSRTFAFVSAVPNWLYLPLPIAEALFGQLGTRTVLLGNLGMLAWLWTVGIWILQSQLSLRDAIRSVLSKAGLWATLTALPCALLFPNIRNFEHAQLSVSRPFEFVIVTMLQACQHVGSITVPLTLLVTGAQLAELGGAAMSQRNWRSIGAAVATRMIIAPSILWPMLSVLRGSLGREVQTTLALVYAMPVAVSCSMFTRQFGGDDAIAVRTIVVSTIVSVATIPLLFALWPP